MGNEPMKHAFLWTILFILLWVFGYLIYINKEINNLKQNTLSINYKASKESSIETASLLNVSAKAQQGFAYHSVDKGYFISTISATLPDPPEGFFYQAWLVREDLNTEPDVLATGKMKLESMQDHFWAVVYSSKTDYSDYRKVVISLQPENNDQTIGENILVGKY